MQLAPRFFLAATLLLAHVSGCAKTLEKPKEADWSRHDFDGVSLEAPYAFKGNEHPLDGLINIASSKPAKANSAIDIRVDVLQPRLGLEPPSLDQFASAMFTLGDESGAQFVSEAIVKVKVGDLEARRNKATRNTGGVVESLIFKKGKYFWLVEVYYQDKDLESAAKRVLDSVRVEK